MRRLLWRYAVKRARSALYWADLDARRNPRPEAFARVVHCSERLAELELNPPL